MPSNGGFIYSTNVLTGNSSVYETVYTGYEGYMDTLWAGHDDRHIDMVWKCKRVLLTVIITVSSYITKT